ncbi:MAG: RNA-binding protein [Candidatus Cloacimonas sp. SDB]|nr:MAG: RNA-binding protein [Candidatus Cloacimonas sp. SDB]
MMKELIEFVVKALVDDPSAIDIKEVAGDKITIYELRAAKSDIGKVIGKRGRTASAIRTLMNAVSARQGKRAVLEIIE